VREIIRSDQAIFYGFNANKFSQDRVDCILPGSDLRSNTWSSRRKEKDRSGSWWQKNE
jgi:hypothetical protein